MIGSFDKLLEDRLIAPYPMEMKPKGQVVSPELEEYMWNEFRKNQDHKKGNEQ